MAQLHLSCNMVYRELVSHNQFRAKKLRTLFSICKIFLIPHPAVIYIFICFVAGASLFDLLYNNVVKCYLSIPF